MAGVFEDETACGPLCQHPACWHSNTRRAKGFPKLTPHAQPPLDDLDLDLPALKVYNMLEEYGDDQRDKYPAKYGGKPNHERSISFPNLKQPIRTNSIKVTRAPATSPKSSNSNHLDRRRGPHIKLVEVQEVFEPEDFQATWDDTFVPKKFYVWVPNKKKKRNKKKMKPPEPTSAFESPVSQVKNTSPQSVVCRDLTENMIPRELEYEHLMSKKKRAQLMRSPSGMRHFTMTPRTTRGSSKMEFDHEGISELLDLPREILIQVLENTKQSDLMSRDKIREIIRLVMAPQLERGNTNVSLTSHELLQQKKMSLHEGNKNIRQPQLMETKPVFYLDDDVMDEGSQPDGYESEEYDGSLKDLYFGRAGTGDPKDFPKYKKPLPSINHDGGMLESPPEGTKIPSISLGLPELPSGVRQTRPFTYNKRNQFDFTLGNKKPGRATGIRTSRRRGAPVPTPPTSVRTTETPGSDHGTTIRVNVPSIASEQTEYSSTTKENAQKSMETTPLHAVSPTFSTRVPLAPATTPATYHHPPAKSPKSVPTLDIPTTSPVTETPLEWGGREKITSPSNIIRAPVNTPGSLAPDQSGLDTIQETGGEYPDQPLAISRGRSVRFEVPEVPPPPSSPQESEKDMSLGDNTNTEEPSRNTVTVNTSSAKDTLLTKTQTSTTIRTDKSTVNSSEPKEPTFVKKTMSRELSMVSSPEPWPSVNEADYDVTPAKALEERFHASDDNIASGQELKTDKNQSGNAVKDGTKTPPVREEPESPGSDFVNRTTEPASGKVKKLMEESRKTDSPAPPPPSPEAKDEDSKKPQKRGAMLTVPEEGDETHFSMTVMQISPKGLSQKPTKQQRNLDTFVNIDIPATADKKKKEPTPVLEEEEETEKTEDEDRPTLAKESSQGESRRDIALSVQSTLAARTISDRTFSQASSSMIEPAMSQASRGPALSDDGGEGPDKGGLLLQNWEGITAGSQPQLDTEAGEVPAEKPEEGDQETLDMSEDGGDHEGFKADLKREYEKLMQRTERNLENLDSQD